MLPSALASAAHFCHMGGGQYGCLRKKQYKCGNSGRKRNRFKHASNKLSNGRLLITSNLGSMSWHHIAAKWAIGEELFAAKYGLLVLLLAESLGQ